MAERDFGERFAIAFGRATNREIAAKLGVSAPAVQNYKAGRVPQYETLLKIAAVTKCDLHWLLTGEGTVRRERAFDLEYEIEQADDWREAIDKWYEFEGRPNPMPEEMGVAFMGGWHSFDRQQKINAVKDFKAFLDTLDRDGDD